MRSLRSPRRGHQLRRGGGVALLTLFLGVAVATPASAHPYLLRSDPASGAILATAPTRIDIDYTEGLDRSYCNVVLVAPDGARIATHQVAASGAAELAVAPDRALSADGTYAVEWTAVGDDGHTVIGNFGFSLGHPSANAAVAGTVGTTTGSASSPGGIQRLLRTVLPLATVLLAALLLLGSTIAPAGRRAARARLGAYLLQAGLLGALVVSVLADGGTSAFDSSATGQRLIAEVALTALALPVVLDRGRLAASLRPAGWRRAVGPVVAAGLLVVLAASGHASSQPVSRRALVLAVYSVHLLAVSIWLGALSAVVLRLRRPAEPVQPLDVEGDVPERSLRPLVAGSLLATLATGVATTDWGLRTLHDVPTTLYGKLALTKVALFALIIAVGVLASWFTVRRGNRRVGGRLVAAEAAIAGVTLVVAGVLGQIAQPLEQPYPSQAYAADTGVSVSVASAGPDSLDVATLAPGIVGRNTLVVEVGDSDEQDFLSPAHDVRTVRATLSCGGCGAQDVTARLRPTGGGSEWTGDVTLPRASSWLVTAAVRRGSAKPQTVRLAARVTPATLPSQVVVGVPAALSGATGETCRDQLLGLQTALSDLNSSAADHGTLLRVVTVDLHDGPQAALARLRALGARLVALPCGTSNQISALTAGARRAGLPVVLGAADDSDVESGVWSTQPSWGAEGSAIARQAAAQGATDVTAVTGPSAVDHAELAGLRSGLRADGIALRVARLPHRAAAAAVKRLARGGSDLVAVLGNPTEAAPFVRGMSAVEQSTGWLPPRGVLASAQLMSTDFINGAGTITRLGGIEFASDIDPFDPVSQYYAQRLRALSPGVRPSFNGLHGYEAGLAIAQAMKDGGGSPSPGTLHDLLATHFADFTVGSYHLGWHADGGTSTSLAFFRSTYVNPMAMPAVAPGGASSLAHEGTFLDAGGFEQVAPFRRIQ